MFSNLRNLSNMFCTYLSFSSLRHWLFRNLARLKDLVIHIDDHYTRRSYYPLILISKNLLGNALASDSILLVTSDGELELAVVLKDDGAGPGRSPSLAKLDFLRNPRFMGGLNFDEKMQCAPGKMKVG
jgi:hypothetical protein